MDNNVTYNLVCSCGSYAVVSVWPAFCGCGKKYTKPSVYLPVVEPMEYPPCIEREEGICNVATMIAGKAVFPTAQDCVGCRRFDSTHNEITKALAVEANPLLSTPERGVGTRVAKTIGWFIPKPSGCECQDREEVMNMWGPDKCQENMRTILGWLRESALDNEYPYSEFVAYSMVTLCIKISRKLDYN